MNVTSEHIHDQRENDNCILVFYYTSLPYSLLETMTFEFETKDGKRAYVWFLTTKRASSYWTVKVEK